MKLRITIITVETIGDALKVTGQGTASGAPSWRTGSERISFTVPETKTNQRTLFIGRELDVVITPRGRR